MAILSSRSFKREDTALHFARTVLAAHVWSKIFTSRREGGRLKRDNPTGDYATVRNAFLFNATRIFNERHLDDVSRSTVSESNDPGDVGQKNYRDSTYVEDDAPIKLMFILPEDATLYRQAPKTMELTVDVF